MEAKSSGPSGRFNRLLSGVVGEGCAKETEAWDEDRQRRRVLVPEADTLSVTAAHDEFMRKRDLELAMRLDVEYADELRSEAKAVAADAELAKCVEAQLEQEDRDALLARKLEQEAKAEDKEAEDRAAVAQRLALEDEKVALRVQKKMERQFHRERKAKQASDNDGLDDRTLWAQAADRLELEDVEGAICISIRLPKLGHVTVKPADRRFIVIDARAAPVLGERSKNTEDQLLLAAYLKLEMVSQGCSLKPADLQFEYDSDSSYLHVYVENLKLATLAKSQRADAMKVLRKSLLRSVSDKCKKVVTLIIDSHTK